jgi:hypothetical protein
MHHRPKRFLNRDTKSSSPDNSPEPLVPKLLRPGPEGILLLAELLKLGELLGLRLGVAALLVRLGLLVAAKVPQEAVVRDRAEELDGGEHVGAVEEDDERGVH